MREIRDRVIDFYKKYEMDFEDIDMEKCCNIFLEEMEKGLAGEGSSLKMIPTYIEVDREIPINEPVIVLDAGGTHFRVATVYFDKKRKPVIENLRLHPMPGSNMKISKKTFFEIIAGYTEAVINISQNVGFCFSYAVEIFPSKDGKVIYFSKEVQAKEAEGEMIGENLNLALAESGFDGKKHIVLLNDTVATLLAGKSAFQKRAFDSYVGFILGTGTNCCYIENNDNIKKMKSLDPTKSQIVNVESGGFARGPRGKIDMKFDELTTDPEMYTFEKMISGRYLGPLCLSVINVAAKDGLFSDNIARMFKKIKGLDTEDINDFMYYPAAKNNPLASIFIQTDEKDRITLYYLLDRLIERAAKLTAINISSVVIKSDKGGNPCYPVCITAEGSTFYGLKSLKKRVEYYLKIHLEEKNGCYYEIVNIENATLIGAAIAGLTN